MTPSPTTRARRPRRSVRVVVNLVYAAVLVVLATVPEFPAGVPSVSDTWAHASAYGLQAVLIYWALVATTSRMWAATGAFVGATAFGIATEALQLLQPARSVDPRDVAANMVGAALACVVAIAVDRTIAAWR